MVDEWVKKVWEEARREREEKIRKLKEISEALDKVIDYVIAGNGSSDLLELLTELQVKVDRKITRAVFDSKVSEIMEKYGYVDIDEGEREAVTEKKVGYIRLYYKDGRADSWFFVSDLKNHNVELYIDKSYEGGI